MDVCPGKSNRRPKGIFMREKLQQEKVQTIMWVAVLAFLGCYFMMLFDFPNVLTILISGVFCLALLIKQQRIRIDLGIGLLTLTNVSYFIIVFGMQGLTMSLLYIGLALYVLGNYLGAEAKIHRNSEKIFFWLLLVLVAGHCVHGILNSYLFLDKQWDNGDIRVWLDWWTKFYLPGTAQIVYFLPALAMVFPGIIYFKNRKLFYSVMIVCAAFFTYIAMYSQTRTSVLILPLVFAAQLFLYVILEWKKVKKILSTKQAKITGIVLIVALAAAIFLLKDHPVVKEFMGIMSRDGGILNNIRFKLQRMALEQLFVYPMGGDQMSFMGYPHAHNAWLDMANMGGIIPFFAFVIYTLVTIYELIRWLMKKYIPVERKLLMAGVYGAFFLYYMVERAYESSMHFMTPWFFINGLVHGELTKEK